MRPRPARTGMIGVALLAALIAPSSARAAPANDDFASAAAIESLPFEAQIDVTGATREPEDGIVSCNGTYAGFPVWYRYDSTEDAHAVVRLWGQDAFVAVYEGSQRPTLTKVACLDSWGDYATVFSPRAGSTYYVAVGNYYDNIDPHVWLRIEHAPSFDTALTRLDVEASDAVNAEHVVTIEASNLGGAATSPATATIVVVARPKTRGDCVVIASDPIVVQPGSTEQRSYTWTPLAGAGRFEITATLVVREAVDTDDSNNRRTVQRDVIVQGTELGVAVPLANAC